MPKILAWMDALTRPLMASWEKALEAQRSPRKTHRVRPRFRHCPRTSHFRSKPRTKAARPLPRAIAGLRVRGQYPPRSPPKRSTSRHPPPRRRASRPNPAFHRPGQKRPRTPRSPQDAKPRKGTRRVQARQARIPGPAPRNTRRSSPCARPVALCIARCRAA